MIVKVTGDVDAFGHGEIEANPKPAPMSSSTRVVDAATTDPAKMAAQEMADTEDSAVSREPSG